MARAKMFALVRVDFHAITLSPVKSHVLEVYAGVVSKLICRVWTYIWFTPKTSLGSFVLHTHIVTRQSSILKEVRELFARLPEL